MIYVTFWTERQQYARRILRATDLDEFLQMVREAFPDMTIEETIEELMPVILDHQDALAALVQHLIHDRCHCDAEAVAHTRHRGRS